VLARPQFARSHASFVGSSVATVATPVYIAPRLLDLLSQPLPFFRRKLTARRWHTLLGVRRPAVLLSLVESLPHRLTLVWRDLTAQILSLFRRHSLPESLALLRRKLLRHLAPLLGGKTLQRTLPLFGRARIAPLLTLLGRHPLPRVAALFGGQPQSRLGRLRHLPSEQ
jgi:hypothetical protein